MIDILYLHSGAELYGADQILINIVTNLDREKYTPHVLIPNDGPLKDILDKSNIDTTIIDYPIIRRKYFNPKGMIEYCVSYMKSIKRISNYIEEHDIKIIHNNTLAVLEGIYFSTFKNIPVIFHLHEMIEHPRVVAKIMYKIALNHSTKVLGVSEALKKYVLDLTKSKKDMLVLHNGIVDKSLLEKKVDIRKELGIPKDAIVYTHVGRINAIKGQKDFVDALKKTENQNIYGLIIGDAFSGEEWRVNGLVDYINNSGISNRIIYPGFREDMQNVYNITDVLVLSSVQYDSFPTVVLEALSFSKPVIAYDCGGVVEMVQDENNGYIVDQGDIEALSSKIEYLSKDFNIRKKMGMNSRIRFEKEFSIREFIIRLQDIYNNLI